MKAISTRSWRWISSAAVLCNVCFNYVYQTISDIPPVKEVSDRYPNLFTPASYAFSIWGLIYFSFLVYAVLQLLPSSRHKRYFDALSVPFALANVCCSLWILVFGESFTGLSVVILFGLLALSILLYVKAEQLTDTGVASEWLLFPFSLFMAWLSVASIANIAVWLVSLRLPLTTPTEMYVTVIMMSIAASLGLWMGLSKHNWIYPVVIGWALMAIYAERQYDVKPVGSIAFLLGVVMLLLAFFLAIGKLKESKHRILRTFSGRQPVLSEEKARIF